MSLGPYGGLTCMYRAPRMAVWAILANVRGSGLMRCWNLQTVSARTAKICQDDHGD